MIGVLKTAGEFSPQDIQRICQGFEKRLGAAIEWSFERDETLLGGFAAYIDGSIYDGSLRSHVSSIKHAFEKEKPEVKDGGIPSLKSFMDERFHSETDSLTISEYGTVRSCSDDIIRIDGCSHCRYGEILVLSGGQFALALDLNEHGVSAVLLEKDRSVVPGDIVRGTGRVADICVGQEMLGRVVDPIGRPLDGLPLQPTKWRHTECAAPTIMQRSPVNQPLETGLLAIDSMIPIGRGQRELIVGDRQTGKTTIALSAMMNQKKGDVICIYCAIAQKASTVSYVAKKLKDAGVMDNCIIVASTADQGVAMQYLTPYAGCAIAENFMYEGKDVLIVYDDLSKHAMAYRSMSLLLRRPSGREAYPGDVFYLHSRLLERSAKLSKEMGGGSITALPIVETMAGDISAYIPTNVISITDGQIYLESELFNAGICPAVNVGLSVSRVGRSAQHNAMKKTSGTLRLDLAQYRDTAVFAQFGTEIDESTSRMLKSGERLTELLKQTQDEVLKLSEQVAVLLAYRMDLFLPLETKKVSTCKKEMLAYLNKHIASTMHSIDQSGCLSDTAEDILKDMLTAFFGAYANAKR